MSGVPTRQAVAPKTAAREVTSSGAQSTDVSGREVAIGRQEHLANLRRFHRAFQFGLGIWIAFGPADWLVVTYLDAGDLRFFWTVRVLVAPVIAVAIWLSGREPPLSPRGLRRLNVLTLAAGSAGIALMCVPFRGLVSPYYGGVMLVVGMEAVLVAEPWRVALGNLLVIWLVHPLVLAGGALVSPVVAAQWSDPATLTQFGLQQIFIASLVVFGVIASELFYRLRRQVFESKSIGRYRLKERIGSGGMGDVWRAYHRQLERDVALKILHREREMNPEAVRRFEREIRATAALQHPNTVRLYDHGVTEDGLWYYAMELLEGRDLQTLVKEQGPLAVWRAVDFIHQASRALAEAHGLEIVHRDVKPANLFIAHIGAEDDFVKVLDFGIAKLAAGSTQSQLTVDGWIGGTPSYMSPEVASGKPADARSDVYALGATLFFTLTGKPPFEGANVPALLYAQLNEMPPSVAEKRGANVGADLEAIVARCLEKRPEARYANGGALALALAEWLLHASEQNEAPHVRPAQLSFAPPPRVVAPDAPTLAGHGDLAHAGAPERDEKSRGDG